MNTGRLLGALGCPDMRTLHVGLRDNYRRQIQLKLAEQQVDAYTSLWTTTGSATPERTTPLDRDERQKLYDSMVDWYFHRR